MWFRYGGSPTVWEFLLESLRHKGSAGLGFGGRSFGEACFSIVGIHHFVPCMENHVHVLNHFFVGMPADFAIRTTREGLLKIFCCKKQYFRTRVITTVWLWRTLIAGTCDQRGIWEHSKKLLKDYADGPVDLWRKAHVCVKLLEFIVLQQNMWRNMEVSVVCRDFGCGPFWESMAHSDLTRCLSRPATRCKNG